MKMPSLKLVATVAILSAATSVAAFPYPGADQFTDAKTGFRVQISYDGSTMHLIGRQPVTRETFDVAVSGDKVTGVWAGKPVNYTLIHDARGGVASVVDASLLASR